MTIPPQATITCERGLGMAVDSEEKHGKTYGEDTLCGQAFISNYVLLLS